MEFNNKIIMLNIIIFLILSLSINFAQTPRFETVQKFFAEEARQGVAVDENYIYVIGNREIGKYDKKTTEIVAQWKDEEGGKFIHMDSGVIVDGKLYCAHSNYPYFPMTSSIEIFDPKTLEHIETHSFGIYRGSCTWVDYYNGFWWAAFAHYNKWRDSTNADVRYTSVVKFDDHWREVESWTFPKEVFTRFGEMSNSGGSWGPDGLLYCTGHDNNEVYGLKIPDTGSVLELVRVIQIESFGQGIAWDRSDPNFIYGIIKSDCLIIKSSFKINQSNESK